MKRAWRSRLATRPSAFDVLGLPARPDITDDDVRAAWRRLAAATHPDRDDGGDAAAFAAAAAAYTELRTRAGRGEALAGLADQPASAPLPKGMLARARQGRPVFLALRLAAAAAVSATAIALAGPAPATLALITGVITWLLLTARHDLAPRYAAGRQEQSAAARHAAAGPSSRRAAGP